jgi:hypothetical protein
MRIEGGLHQRGVMPAFSANFQEMLSSSPFAIPARTRILDEVQHVQALTP